MLAGVEGANLGDAEPREGRQPLHAQCASRVRGSGIASRSTPMTGAPLRWESGATGDTRIVSVLWTAARGQEPCEEAGVAA